MDILREALITDNIEYVCVLNLNLELDIYHESMYKRLKVVLKINILSRRTIFIPSKIILQLLRKTIKTTKTTIYRQVRSRIARGKFDC